MRIYLDNCCYNRPFDDQTQLRISLESQAKLHIQEMIKNGKYDLVSSFILLYENSQNRIQSKKRIISDFINEFCAVYVGEDQSETVRSIAKEITKNGIKPADSVHVACAIIASCDYFLTTDDRLLKYTSDKIKVINPTEFIRIEGGNNNEQF